MRQRPLWEARPSATGFIPPSPGQQLVSHPAPPLMSESEDFHFNDAMRQTRQRAEELLGQGKIEEAEAYMEQRRQLMAAHGYYIRKNQPGVFRVSRLLRHQCGFRKSH